MRSEDIDRMLTHEDDIVPSSGFATSVMEAVTREATAPPPIAFPWKRALPGLSWCLAVIAGFLVTGLRSSANASATPEAVVPPAVLAGVGWIAAALAASLFSAAVSTRIARSIR